MATEAGQGYHLHRFINSNNFSDPLVVVEAVKLSLAKRPDNTI